MRTPAIAKLAVLLCLLLCMGTHPARADGTPTVLQVTLLPFTPQHRFTGQPLVQVKINGTVDATFVLDTGTTISAIQETLATQLHLTPKLLPEVTMDGKPIYIVTPRFELKRFNFPESPAMLIGKNQLPSEVEQKVSGIIGLNVLKLFAIVFDFQKNIILMIGDGNLNANELKAAGFNEAVMLPLSKNENNLYVVNATVQNKTLRGTEPLIVDTGADNTEVSHSLANLLHLPLLRETDGWGFITGDYKKSWSQATLTLGDITLPNQEVAFPSSAKAKAFSILGTDVLSRYHVLIDFPANKMYLAPSVPAIVQVKPQK